MNYWLETSKKNLLPLSQATEFVDAIKEWEWRGDFIDHLEAVETCELCEHESLRYHFKIANRFTDKVLWVGSSCIKRFNDIGVYDEHGNRLEGEQRDEELQNRIERDRFERMKTELNTLWSKVGSLPVSPRGMISKRVVDSIRRCVQAGSQAEHQGFTPYELIGLFRNMRRLEIPYTPGLYKVSLRKNEDKEEMQAVKDMERCLSLEQRKRYQFEQIQTE